MNKTKIYKIETVERIEMIMIVERKALISYSGGWIKQGLEVCDGETQTTLDHRFLSSQTQKQWSNKMMNPYFNKKSGTSNRYLSA